MSRTIERPQRPHRPQTRSAGAWLLLLVIAAAGCTPVHSQTRVDIAIDAQGSLRQRITHVDIEAYIGTSRSPNERHFTDRLAPFPPTTGWPLRFSLVRASEDESTYRLVATAKDMSDATVATVSSVGDYRDQRSFDVPLLFDLSCAQLASPCADGLTCQAGACVDARVPVDMPEADAGMQPGITKSNPPPGCPPGAACTPPTGSCEINNGGCDPLSKCSAAQSTVTCGACPDGFTGDARLACTAVLSAVDVTSAALEPAFDPDHTDYILKIGLIGDRWTLTPTAADKTSITANGEDLAPGTAFTPRRVTPDGDTLVLSVSAPGHKGRTYRFQVRQSGEQTGYIKASNPGAGDTFGSAIAMSADTLVVGAPNEDSAAKGVNPPDTTNNAAKDSGAVYVFVRTGQTWSQQAYIKPSDTAAGQIFGCSVAIDGDTLVVGSSQDANVGSAYVFERQGTQWTEVKKLGSLNPGANAQFGQSVTVQGDVIVVGQGGGDLDGVNDSGAAYLYRRSAPATWAFSQPVRPKTLAANAWFGSCVVLHGDYLVVGTTGAGTNSIFSGVAHVFKLGNTMEELQVLQPSAESTAAYFGAYIAVSDDTIAVSAFNGDGGLSNGVVYIYTLTADGTFTQQTTFPASNAAGGDFFGHGLALSGDTLVVGAQRESSGARGINGDLAAPALSRSGAAYVFTRNGGVWSQRARIKAAAPSSDDELGTDVAISGDVIAISAASDSTSAGGINPGHDQGAMGSGALYLFH